LGGRNIPIGRPTGNTTVYVLDDRLEPVPAGLKGELYIGGAKLARGYLNRPDLTAERFIPDPFSDEPGSRLYRTGDLCRWQVDGNVEYLGRSDHQVKLRGHRIELGEIEATLLRHPVVRQAVVALCTGAGGQPELAAYAVPEQGLELASATLRDYLKQNLPEPMVPSVYLIMDELPQGPSGKVNRAALPAPQRVEASLEAHAEPQTETEQQIAAVWRDLLGVQRIGLHDNFFQLGGHSMIATVAVSRMRDLFRVELSVRQLFEAPTLAELALRVDATRWAVESLRSAASTASAAMREEGVI
jgi:hypothetical protein